MIDVGPLRGVGGVLLDLDGCVWFGGRLAPDAAVVVRALREAGVRVGFLTNASTAPGAAYAARLRESGVACADEEVLAPLDTVVGVPWLVRGERALAIGRDAVGERLAAAGVVLVEDPAAADAVVLGNGGAFDAATLARATRALRGGARLLALNDDPRVPVGDGEVVPGTGALAAALAVAGDVPVEVVGKPSRPFFERALARLGVPREAVLMVGDNPTSDVAGGRAAGLRTVWIDGGAFRAREGARPDLVVSSLAALLPLVGGRRSAGSLAEGRGNA